MSAYVRLTERLSEVETDFGSMRWRKGRRRVEAGGQRWSKVVILHSVPVRLLTAAVSGLTPRPLCVLQIKHPRVVLDILEPISSIIIQK